MARRVLVIAYYFPPLGGVGVQRTLKFVEHLPMAGWEVHVVAPKGARYRIMEPSLLAEPGAQVDVHRAICVEPAGIRALARRIVRPVRRARASPVGPPRRSVPASPSRHGRLRRWLNSAWALWVHALFVPDEQMAWIPSAASAAVRVHRRAAIDVIYSSGPPFSTHLAAGLAKTMIRRPWVADFRDPWVGNSFATKSWALRRLDAWQERWVIRKADRVVFATPGLRARYAARYPRQAGRFVTITNGYDRPELGTWMPSLQRRSRRLRLVYTGSVYGERELAIFLEGLERAAAQRPDLRDNLAVDFYGWLTEPNRRMVSEYGLRSGPPVTAHGVVPRSEAMQHIRSADAGLLLLADGPDRDLFVGAKLFEYIGLNRQVLAMAPQGDTRSILAQLDWGIVADPDPDAVASAIMDLVDSPMPERVADPNGRFDRRLLAAELGKVLDAASRG